MQTSPILGIKVGKYLKSQWKNNFKTYDCMLYWI